MEKGDRIELTITDMTDDGRGIGHVDGMAVFADDAIPGDVVEAEVIRVKKRYADTSVQRIVSPSSDRVEPVCPYFGRCGGCSLQSMKYEAQLVMKRGHVLNKLTRIGGLKDPEVHEVVTNRPDADLQYRNKATFAAVETKSGVLVGFRQRGSARVIDIDDCMLQKEPVLAIARAMRQILRSGILRVHTETRSGTRPGGRHHDTGDRPGRLREFTVKACEGTGEMMVVLTVTSAKLQHAEEIIRALDDAVNEVTDAYSLESVILEVKRGDIHDPASRYVPLAGSRTIRDHVEFRDRSLDFEISAPAFYQVNTAQMIQLYEITRRYARLTGEEVVFDLYCGIGTIGLAMADRAAMVVGIEVVPGAVLDANRNAVINGIVNARYYTGRTEDVLPEILDPSSKIYADYLESEQLTARPRVAILDPPRGGCDEALLQTVADAGMDRIVYVSCDAGTLARDLKILGSLGYRFEEATPVEMFAWTSCIEVVVLLSRVGTTK